MKESTITIRVDELMKERATKACSYMSSIFTSVMTHALRSEIHKYH
jgi:antitoxin component of RelBE/YafQ-DinJ toxin-antitoxin module